MIPEVPCVEARTAIFGAFEPQGDGRSRVPVNHRFYPRDKAEENLDTRPSCRSSQMLL